MRKRLPTGIHIAWFRRIAVTAALLLLAACGGGQPPLEVTQAVAKTPAPTLEENPGVEVLWSASASGSKLEAVQFEPVVDSDVVYTASRSGHVEGFDLGSGERVFSHVIGERLANGVGVNATSVVAVTVDGEVIALDRRDGEIKWRYSVERSISAAPALNDQVVAVRTVDGHVVGINAATGKQIWIIERPVAALSLGLDGPGLVAAEGLINGFSSGRLLASNIYNGTTFWEKRAFRPGGKNEIERLIDIDAPPLLAGQAVIVSAYQGGVVAYLLRDGAEAWRNENISTRKPMSIAGRYLGVTGPESELALVDATSGATLWKKTTLRGHGLSAPVVAERSLVVGSMDGVLYFFDLEDGTPDSQYTLGGGAITSLIKVDQGILIYAAESGRLTLVNSRL